MTELHGLPAEVDAELTRRLAGWAAARRLSELDAATARAHVLASVTTVAAESTFDADWLWSLLRPVTDLVERAPGIERWLDAGTYRPYLRLA